jgi:hypothetical protein
MKTQDKDLLIEYLNKGSYQVYSILRHVSQSGMSRRISFYTIIENQPFYLDWFISECLDMKIGKDQGIKVSGCGMDMEFNIVYNLGKELFNDGYKLHNCWL